MPQRSVLAACILLSAACAHGAAAPPPDPAATGANRDEVVRSCIGKAMPAVLAAVAPQLGATCDASARAVASRLFESGARLGVLEGTARVHAEGHKAAAEQLNVAADVAAKIADRDRDEEQMVTRTADDDSAKAAARIAGGTCVPVPIARTIIDEGARCASSAFDTEEYQAEYARAFGAICEHTLSATECAERAQAEYPRLVSRVRTSQSGP